MVYKVANKIAVVDDDEAVLESISSMLIREGYDPVRFHNGTDLLSAKSTLDQCNCLILDIKMPQIDGLNLFKVLLSDGYLLPVVFITGHGSVRLAVEAMKLGAVEFLEKPFNYTMLMEAVSSAQCKYEAYQAHNIKIKNFLSLTTREKEILQLLAAGNKTKDIAKILELSPRTVEIYRLRTYKKLQAKSLAELILIGNNIEANYLSKLQKNEQIQPKAAE